MDELDLVTDEAAFERELEMNRAAYELLKVELKRDHAGKYIGLAFGKLVTVCDDFDQAVAAVRSLIPAPQHYTVFQADSEPSFEIVWDTYTEFL